MFSDKKIKLAGSQCLFTLPLEKQTKKVSFFIGKF